MERSASGNGPFGESEGKGGLYAVGAIACVATMILIATAVGLYFVWPYAPDRMGAEEILRYLARDLLGGLVSLDILMLVIAPINMLVFIALFAALGKANRPLAASALIAGAIAFVLLIVCRPIAELVALSARYGAAAGEGDKAVLVAAAEGLLAYFKGTAWIAQTVLYPIAGMVFAILMRKSSAFSKADSIVGIVVSVSTFGFMLPKVGTLFLFINTIGTLPWYSMIARRLWKLAKGRSE